jgi:hypothetical protein
MKKIIVASVIAALLLVVFQYANTGATNVAEVRGPGPTVITYV